MSRCDLVRPSTQHYARWVQFFVCLVFVASGGALDYTRDFVSFLSYIINCSSHVVNCKLSQPILLLIRQRNVVVMSYGRLVGTTVLTVSGTVASCHILYKWTSLYWNMIYITGKVSYIFCIHSPSYIYVSVWFWTVSLVTELCCHWVGEVYWYFLWRLEKSTLTAHTTAVPESTTLKARNDSAVLTCIWSVIIVGTDLQVCLFCCQVKSGSTKARVAFFEELWTCSRLALVLED